MKQNEQEAKKKECNLPPFQEALFRNRRVVCGKVWVPSCVPPVRIASMRQPSTTPSVVDLNEVALRHHRRESIRQAIRRRVSIAQLHANQTKLAIQSLLSLNG